MPEDESKESKHVARMIICYIEVNYIYHIVVFTEIYCRFTINRLG